MTDEDQFTSTDHVHCKKCGKAVELLMKTGEHGHAFFEVADHTCPPPRPRRPGMVRMPPRAR